MKRDDENKLKNLQEQIDVLTKQYSALMIRVYINEKTLKVQQDCIDIFTTNIQNLKP